MNKWLWVESEGEEGEAPTCPACGGPVSESRPFGHRLWCRCRDCGVDWLEDDGEAEEVDSENR